MQGRHTFSGTLGPYRGVRPTGGGRTGEALRWLTIQGAVIASAAVVIASAAVVIASAAQPGAAGRH
ncbi:hypothetical protein A5644_24440 [Mycobacterium intracellulare subsp. yongonense]|nr:hypothetical protein A5644_24440 [Mycobacterium intracellulare subsp. yongonense]